MNKDEHTRKQILDSQIKSRIEYSLLLNPLMDVDKIDVEVSDGHVTLKGTVDAYWKTLRAKTISTNTKGVVDVTNKLDIDLQREYPDTEIAQDVVQAIERRPGVSQEEVEVKVSDGEVILEGTVPNWFTYSQIKISSEHAVGVIGVVDKMEIEC